MSMAISVALAYDDCIDGIYYNFDIGNGTATVTYQREYGSDYSEDVIIPETVTYNGTLYSVISIGENAFYNCTGLTSIAIPEGVTEIKMCAFSGCENLSNISFPNSLANIRQQAFEYCSSLTSIIIPDNVVEIGMGTFRNCI